MLPFCWSITVQITIPYESLRHWILLWASSLHLHHLRVHLLSRRSISLWNRVLQHNCFAPWGGALSTIASMYNFKLFHGGVFAEKAFYRVSWCIICSAMYSFNTRYLHVTVNGMYSFSNPFTWYSLSKNSSNVTPYLMIVAVSGGPS